MRITLPLVAALTLLTPVQPIPAQAPHAEIQALLERRAAALRDGDRDAFLATVDRADEGFTRRQSLSFEGFTTLGISEYRLDLDVERMPELTTRREVARYGSAADPRVFHVEERYRIEGYDDAPALEDLYLTFVRRGDGWRVAADDDLDDVGLQSGRKLWELTRIETRRTRHAIFVSSPDISEEGTQITRSVGSAVEEVAARWPQGWDERVVVLAPRDDAELARLLQSTFDLDAFVAFAAASVDRSNDWRLVGDRVLLHRRNFSKYGEEIRRRILVHELVHIATRGISGPHVPAFVDEGVADWVSGDRGEALLAGAVADGTFEGRLPLDHEFVTGTDEEIGAAYQASTSAIGFAADRFGSRAVADFYRLLGDARVGPGTWRYHLDRSMREAFGLGFRAFERRWARSVRASYG